MRGFRVQRKSASKPTFDPRVTSGHIRDDVVEGETCQATADRQEATLGQTGEPQDTKPAQCPCVSRGTVGGQLGTAGKERQVKASFLLSKALHARLKIEAARQGSSILALVSRWIEELTPAA